jgi:hypothetical protein
MGFVPKGLIGLARQHFLFEGEQSPTTLEAFSYYFFTVFAVTASPEASHGGRNEAAVLLTCLASGFQQRGSSASPLGLL